MTKARDLAGAGSAFAAVDATELGYLNNVTSAIQTQLDAKTAKATLTTTGDIYYASGANTPARLGIGSTANVLTVSGGVPVWSAPAGGGKLLQVVNFVGGSATTTSSNNNSDTGLAASITPTSASSKILVTIHQNGMQKSAATADNCMSIFLYRNAVNITATDFAGAKTATAFEIAYGSFSMTYLDSPATTSAITYKTQFRSRGNTASVTVQANGAESYMTLMEIGA
jgi:hypothetical protein